ncbi:hypothetical protein [Agrococcus carbonis]|uniref:Uncharacterized protein n=1 Tax=Agrococcus carbonis TaxID=684552 RepID=A0A1H1PGT9_9MICO|nr:hypothetical protein [Agrococcus carbonis]SDS10511.1 hypothetical protein SAMN04489719_1552 [Agrococcus carbonis]
MTATPTASQGLQLWHLPALRAVPALLVGLPLPFIQLHSPLVGLIALALLLGGTALALFAGRRAVPEGAGAWPVPVAAWTAVMAVVAAVLGAVSATELALGLAVAAWAIPAGALELRAWWRMRAVTEPRILRLARDWRAVGVLTILLGLVFALLRDAVTLTGLVGAYAVIVGVYHALAALSARPARTTTSERSDA